MKKPQICKPYKSITSKMGVTRLHDIYQFAARIPEGKEGKVLLYGKGEADPVLEIPFAEGIGQVMYAAVKAEKTCGLEYVYEIDGIPTTDPWGVNLHETNGVLRAAMEEPTTALSEPRHIPAEKTILYKLHVKGFTAQKNSGVKHKGTFLGLTEKIPYLTELGITSVVLMPICPVQKERKTTEYTPFGAVEKEARENYWGYGESYFCSVNPDYCATDDPAKEFADCVDALHMSGLECILEFCFSEKQTVRQILDILHFWQEYGKVDGFHLLGCGSWKTEVLRDDFLKQMKIYMEDCENSFWAARRNRTCGEWNPGWEQTMRRFLKGDEGMLQIAVDSMRRNKKDLCYVNYFADNDGFTLYDTVSYDRKHNEANGEDNADGPMDNQSWNCGAEGPTRKSAVNELRLRQVRNALTMLFTSQGTPMLYAGDEFLNTQSGNNNAWCQDNETGWLNWGKSKDKVQTAKFVRDLIAFRKEHPVLSGSDVPRMLDYKGYGSPDLSYHTDRAWFASLGHSRHSVGVMYQERYGNEEGADTLLYLAYNMDWEEKRLALPDLKKGASWKILCSTRTGFEVQKPDVDDSKTFPVPARTIMILIGE